MTTTFSPLPGCNSEGYGFLQTNFENIPHPGVDYNINHGRSDDDLGATVLSPWDGTVVAALPKLLYSWGRLVVIRSVLPADVISAGLRVPKGTVIYHRYGHLNGFKVWAGQAVRAGQQIGACGGSNGLQNGPFKNPKDATDLNGQWPPHVHFDIRNGGPGGLPAWDAGHEHAVQEWPSCRGYGYPNVGNSNMLRAVALRWIDPNAAIPQARQPNAYRTPRVLS